MKKVSIYIAVLLFLQSCSGTKQFQVTDNDLTIASKRIPGITINDLQHGYKAYVGNCGGCHRLHSPKEYTVDQWKPIISEMLVKAKLKDESQIKLIHDYLVAKAK